jgi:hypothetical protein
LGIDDCRVGSREVRGATAADAEKLDFSHDEAVAAAVLAHHALEMSEALKVEDLLGRRLAAHTSVPLIVALHETNNAAAAVAKERLLIVGGVVGDELWLLTLTGYGLDGTHHHVAVSLGDLEGCIDLVGVVVCANVLESRLILRLQVLAAGLGKVGRRDGNFKEGKNRGDGLDGFNVEVFPAAKVADVPPKVVVDASRCASNAADQRRGWVRRRKILDQRGCSLDLLEAVEVEIPKSGVLHSWRSVKLWDGKFLNARSSEAGHVLGR